MRSPDSMSEAIALSSPSGRMSKRAREAANRQWLEKYGVKPHAPTEEEIDRGKIASLLSMAEFLRGLVARGMGPRKHAKEAARCEEQARQLREKWETTP